MSDWEHFRSSNIEQLEDLESHVRKGIMSAKKAIEVAHKAEEMATNGNVRYLEPTFFFSTLHARTFPTDRYGKDITGSSKKV